MSGSDPSSIGTGEGGVWRRLERGDHATIDVVVNGQPVKALEGESVATLLLRLGHDHFDRHPKTGEPLAPWCLMGVCFGCPCTIDGRPGTQACLVEVTPELEIRTGVATSKATS